MNFIYSFLRPIKRQYRRVVCVWSNVPTVSGQALEHLAKAEYFKEQKKWEKSLENLRPYLVENPTDVSANMKAVYCYLELGYPGAAYEFTRRVLHIDGSHLEAFELFIDLADRLKIDTKLRKYIIRRFDEDLPHHPSRWSTGVGHAVSFNMTSALGVIASSEDGMTSSIAKAALVYSDKAAFEQTLEESGPAKERVAIRVNLARGNSSEAIRLLAKLPVDQIENVPLRQAIRAAHRKGRIAVAIQLINFYLKAFPDDSWALAKKRTLTEDQNKTALGMERIDVLTNGYDWSRWSEAGNLTPVSEGGKILYLLHNSLPYNSAGYATRSHGIITGLREIGWNAVGVTRPGYPFDRPEAKVDDDSVPATDIVAGVPYHRLSINRERMPKAPFADFQEIYTKRLVRLAKSEKAGLIHGASNYWNGISGVAAARQLGVPSVYEVRGLWEITRISREPEWHDTDEYRFMAEMEAEAARNADVVLALTRALKEELISRGVDGKKIVVTPNGVDPERFIPRAPNLALKQKLGLGAGLTVGYVGSILDYEGIDTLLESIALLRDSGLEFNALIVGDGSFYQQALSLAQELGIADFVKFTGRVPHDEVEDYYSIIDICPLPRHGLPVCEMVSPLKPFEAMAMGKVIVGSNVDAIEEIIQPGVNGLLSIKDNSADLALRLEQLVRAPNEVYELGRSSREWVVKNRSWNSIAGIIDQAYRNAGIVR